MTVGLYFPTLWYYGLRSLVQTAKMPHAKSPSPAKEENQLKQKTQKHKHDLPTVPNPYYLSQKFLPSKEESTCFQKGRLNVEGGRGGAGGGDGMAWQGQREKQKSKD